MRHTPSTLLWMHVEILCSFLIESPARAAEAGCPPKHRFTVIIRSHHSCNQLNNTTSLFDLPLCLLAEPSCSHNNRDLWNPPLSKNFGVAEREEVKDGCRVGLLARDVGFASLFGDE